MRGRDRVVAFSEQFIEIGVDLWHNSAVPVWLERFVLVVLATTFGGIVLLNTLKLDNIQRIGLGIAILGLSVYVAQTIHLFNQSKAPTFSPPISAPPAKQDTPQKDQPPPAEPPKKHKSMVKQEPALPVVKMTYTQEQTNSLLEAAPYAVKVVIQTNVTIPHTSLVVRCNVEVVKADYRMAGTGGFNSSGDGNVDNNKRNYWFFFQEPPFKPETPIVVTLMATQPIHVVSVDIGPPSPF
jgi:hypothetical protein